MSSTLREKISLLCAALMLVLIVYYVLQVPDTKTLPDAIALIVGVMLAMAVVIILSVISLATFHRPERIDERDRLISTKAHYNSYFVLMTGAWLTISQVLFPETLSALTRLDNPTAPAHLLMLTLLAGDFTNFASRVFFYRKGV